MSFHLLRRPMSWGILLALILTTLSFGGRPATPASGDNAIRLTAPSFVAIANAQDEGDAPTAFPQDEAGISAYFRSATPVNLPDVRSVFRVIEVETADYIIGSVAVAEYSEVYDVHLYIHRDGWFLVYYLATDPIAKTFDWKDYVANSTRIRIQTTLDKVAVTVASLVGVPTPSLTYYDFRYPNATHMMLIAEDENNGNEFTVKLPSSFTYYERSWGLYNTDHYYGSAWVLNGVTMGSVCDGCLGYGTLTASQLLPDTTHTITIDDFGGLVLIYRVP